MQHLWRRATACLSVVAATAVMSASPITVAGAAGPNALSRRVLSPDGLDSYRVVKSGASASMLAPSTNTGTNLRELFWTTSGPAVVNSVSCATWAMRSTNSLQEGLAVRIADGPASIRAITVTKNVIYGIHWVYNVHTWDTANATAPSTQVAQFDMGSLVTDSTGAYLPSLSGCVRVIGSRLDFKLWPPTIVEPQWTNATYVRSTTLPAGWDHAGSAGWYIGHMPAGGSAKYTNLHTRALV